VILLHNSSTSEALILCASEHYNFTILMEDLPLRGFIKVLMMWIACEDCQWFVFPAFLVMVSYAVFTCT
jgi:hypothetical protein